jgi:hypothetical protein
MERNEGCKKCEFFESGVNEINWMFYGWSYCAENPKTIREYDPVRGAIKKYEYAECEVKNKNGKCKAFKRKLSFWERIF